MEFSCFYNLHTYCIMSTAKVLKLKKVSMRNSNKKTPAIVLVIVLAFVAISHIINSEDSTIIRKTT